MRFFISFLKCGFYRYIRCRHFECPRVPRTSQCYSRSVSLFNGDAVQYIAGIGIDRQFDGFLFLRFLLIETDIAIFIGFRLDLIGLGFRFFLYNDRRNRRFQICAGNDEVIRAFLHIRRDRGSYCEFFQFDRGNG